MNDLPLSSKMLLYHIRDTTLSAGPMRRAPRFHLGLPIGITVSATAVLCLVARAFA